MDHGLSITHSTLAEYSKAFIFVLLAILIRSDASGQNFSGQLRTDFSISSIDTGLIRNGGPGKDGIPALNNPSFVSPSESVLTDNSEGILLEIGGIRRFYPYGILVWHELVNDSIGGHHFVVTFCPLCGTGMVFNRNINGQIVRFGVSGLLFESNLLMYDNITESLWSQSRFEAVVGRMTGKRLQLLPMQVVTLGNVRQIYPDTQVLNTNTGFRRRYGQTPYGGYGSSTRLVFPVTRSDSTFHPKAMMCVLDLGDLSIAVPNESIRAGTSETVINGRKIGLQRMGEEIAFMLNGKPRPFYYEMWFSWYTQHHQNGTVWVPEY